MFLFKNNPIYYRDKIINSDGFDIGINYAKKDGTFARACTNDLMKVSNFKHHILFEEITDKQLALICRVLKPHINELFDVKNDEDRKILHETIKDIHHRICENSKAIEELGKENEILSVEGAALWKKYREKYE